MLEHTRTLACSSPTICWLLLLYCVLVRPKLKYASPVWNNITTADASNMSRIQRKFASLCFSHFSLIIFIIILKDLSFWISTHYKLEDTRLALFFSFMLSRDQNCFLPSRNIRNLALFSPVHKMFPSATCAVTANPLRKDMDVFSNQIRILKHTLRQLQFALELRF